jgi:hypothetical protein
VPIRFWCRGLILILGASFTLFGCAKSPSDAVVRRDLNFGYYGDCPSCLEETRVYPQDEPDILRLSDVAVDEANRQIRAVASEFAELDGVPPSRDLQQLR